MSSLRPKLLQNYDNIGRMINAIITSDLNQAKFKLLQILCVLFLLETLYVVQEYNKLIYRICTLRIKSNQRLEMEKGNVVLRCD